MLQLNLFLISFLALLVINAAVYSNIRTTPSTRFKIDKSHF